ncbi:hypothetical protein KQ41_20810 [Lysinibacillus fusiformis]|nr:hypothetical protein KQ41_20810 [Lysinibacillus fusiformis]
MDNDKRLNLWIIFLSIILVICLPFIIGKRENYNDNLENLIGTTDFHLIGYIYMLIRVSVF